MSTTVLAVDDSVTMRKVLEITFGGDEFNAVLAASSEQAMQLLASTRPAIAVVDHTIGNANGYDLCRQIKTASPQTKVIILSSKQHPFDRARGTASGADDFMDKPFDTEKMLEKMRFVAAQPSKPIAAGAAAPVAAAPAAAARPAPAAPSTIASTAPRPRAQTLSYGTPAPTPSPAPAAAAAPRTAPTLPGTPAATPQPSPRPAPSVSAKPAPAAAKPQAAAVAAAAVTAGNGQLAGKLEGIGLTPDQVQAVLALSREVVEQVVWEVVPVLAETIIKEEIRRLTSD